MKKCDFCVYRAYTERGEQVCTKRLHYVEELEGDFMCSDFTINGDVVPVAIIMALAVGLMVFLVSII